MIKLLKRLFKVKRYFLLSYKFYTVDNKNGEGYCFFTTLKGNYLNMNESYKHIKEQSPHLNIETIITTNIIEMSKSDYLDWHK